MISSPFTWLLGLGRSPSTSSVANTTYQTAVNQSTISTGTATGGGAQLPPNSSTPTSNNLSLQRNLNQLVDEGQRSSLKNKRELINNLDQLSTLAFLNSSTGVNVQRIQDQFEKIDKTLQTTTPSSVLKPRDLKDETLNSQLDGKLTSNLNDFLKREREKSLLSMLRMIEDQVEDPRRITSISISLFQTYDEITRHSNYVFDRNWQKQRQSILSSVSKHDQSYLDEANAMQVKNDVTTAFRNRSILFLSLRLDQTLRNPPNIVTGIVQCGNSICQSGRSSSPMHGSLLIAMVHVDFFVQR